MSCIKNLVAGAFSIVYLLMFSLPVKAQVAAPAQEIKLWPGTPPDGPGPQEADKITDKGSYTLISNPRLIVHKPEHPNGTAILVISGGGYGHIEVGNESSKAANWLQSIGVTAFELVYRLPREGWASVNVPLQDGQRAMRLIRSMAGQYKLDNKRIGIMGFSAGGHLAGMTAVEPDNKLYAAVDKADKLSARPDFEALLYPVLTLTDISAKTRTRKEMIGTNPTDEQQEMYSAELHVSAQTPPTFLAQALDDPTSPVDNSRLMYAALQKNNVNAEIHLFDTGGHGWGMGKPGSPVAVWPQLFEAWAKKNGFIR